jgi:hypothetical protein
MTKEIERVHVRLGDPAPVLHPLSIHERQLDPQLAP